MFKHLFKLIWNKKKQNFLLMSEMLISFLVIFAVFTLLLYYYNNYKKPMGMVYDDVWVVNYNNSFKTNNTDSLNTYYETLKQTVKALPQVKDLSFCSSNIPFSHNQWQGGMTYKGKSVNSVNQYHVTESYKDVMGMQVLEGRWFNSQDVASKYKPIIINHELRAELFGNEKVIGAIIGDGDNKVKMKVVGVVQGIKVGGDYLSSGKGVYHLTDTSFLRNFGTMMIKVTPGADANFEGRLYKTLANFMRGSNIEIEHMDNKLSNTNYFSVIPMIFMSVVSCFLIINVALGLFGVLWYNINKRRGEIGLRRAIGATGNSVSTQLIAESMILATLSLIIGTFFAIQFPLLNVFNLEAGIYLFAMLFAIIFIYLLVFICSLYPGKQAAAIYPAVALHEE